MKCIAFIQTKEGQATKASLEAAGFAAGIGEAVAIVSGELQGDGGLGNVGINRILQGPGELDDSQLGRLVSAAAEHEGAEGDARGDEDRLGGVLWVGARAHGWRHI